MREVVFDTETTGLEPKQGHRIIEIGCVELVNQKVTGNVYHAYINPGRDVPKAVTAIHGITESFLEDKPVFKKIAKDFLKFVGDAKLVIHNAAFDLKFINHELELANLTAIETSRVIDTLTIAKAKFPGSKVNLNALCERFGVSLKTRDKHGALIDSQLLAEVYIALLGGNQNELFQGQNFTKTAKDSSQIFNLLPDKVFSGDIVVREFAASDEELELHRNFISKKVKNSLWNT